MASGPRQRTRPPWRCQAGQALGRTAPEVRAAIQELTDSAAGEVCREACRRFFPGCSAADGGDLLVHFRLRGEPVWDQAWENALADILTLFAALGSGGSTPAFVWYRSDGRIEKMPLAAFKRMREAFEEIAAIEDVLVIEESFRWGVVVFSDECMGIALPQREDQATV